MKEIAPNPALHFSAVHWCNHQPLQQLPKRNLLTFVISVLNMRTLEHKEITVPLRVLNREKIVYTNLSAVVLVLSPHIEKKKTTKHCNKNTSESQLLWKRALRSLSPTYDQTPHCQLDCGTRCIIPSNSSKIWWLHHPPPGETLAMSNVNLNQTYLEQSPSITLPVKKFFSWPVLNTKEKEICDNDCIVRSRFSTLSKALSVPPRSNAAAI